MIDSNRGQASSRIVLSGADLVLPREILSPGTLVLEGGRIAEIAPGSRPGGGEPGFVDCTGHYLVPGFIDVHVHGVEGTDALDGGDGISQMAARLPRYGVSAFCPTSLACDPSALKTMLASVKALRGAASGARVLPAHLESNFINPEYRGAQPLECLREVSGPPVEGSYSGADILHEIHNAQAQVGIMTIAPELPAAIDLIRDLASRGISISLGHSGATYEQALAGIAAGARQATHLFNRMTPLSHRAPGLAAAVLESELVAAELIVDGVHVHPAMARIALAVKGAEGIMAITDGTAGSGLARGSRTSIGSRPITIREAAYLDDGTLAGSVLTMDGAFRMLVRELQVSLLDAARACATTQALALGIPDAGAIVEGTVADLVLLDQEFQVKATYIAGELAWSRPQ